MKVAAIQHDIVWENPAATIESLRAPVAAAADEGAHLIVLSEMFSTGFSMAAERVAEAPEGPSASFLFDQAASTGSWLVASIPTVMPGVKLPQNVLTVASPDGGVHRYAKIHPFSYTGEDQHYAAGEEFLTLVIEGVRCSFFVCYDLRFADEWWALAPQTECYVVPANWPGVRREHWMALLRARAIENQAFVVGVNRVGDGDGVAYAGDSQIIDPFGQIVANGGDSKVTVTAEVTAERVAEVRAQFPFLQDRR